MIYVKELSGSDKTDKTIPNSFLQLFDLKQKSITTQVKVGSGENGFSCNKFSV